MTTPVDKVNKIWAFSAIYFLMTFTLRSRCTVWSWIIMISLFSPVIGNIIASGFGNPVR